MSSLHEGHSWYLALATPAAFAWCSQADPEELHCWGGRREDKDRAVCGVQHRLTLFKTGANRADA